jgi:hypothetical protein
LTAIDGVSQVPASLINDLQDWIVKLWKFAVAPTIVLDHFTGDTIGKAWIVESPDGRTFVDDTANGAAGALQLDTTGSGADVHRRIRAQHISISDFTYEARVRVTALDSAGSIKVGLGDILSAGSGESIYMTVTPSLGNSNWWFVYQIGGTFHRTDTGVSKSSTNYQRLRVTREGSIMTAYIDGVQKVQVSASVNLTEYFGCDVDAATNLAHTTVVFDYLLLTPIALQE